MLNHLLGGISKHPNLIINDPNGKLLHHMYSNLAKHHYHLKVINLNHLQYSDCYNPLALITYVAIYDNPFYAQQLLNHLDSILFYNINPHLPESRFKRNRCYNFRASYLFNALVFFAIAHVYYAYCNHHQDYNDLCNRISIPRIINMAVTLGGQATKHHSNALCNIFNILKSKLRHIDYKHCTYYYKLLYRASNNYKISRLNSENGGSIYTTFIEHLSEFQEPTVAKFTSYNNIQLAPLLFKHLLLVKLDANNLRDGDTVSVRIYNDGNHNRADEFYKQFIKSTTNIAIPLTHKVDTVFSVYLTIHNSKSKVSKTSIINFRIGHNNIVKAIKSNNANIMHIRCIYDNHPRAIFIGYNTPISPKLHKLGLALINQFAWGIINFHKLHSCSAQSHICLLLNNITAHSDMPNDIVKFLNHKCNTKPFDISLIVPSLPLFKSLLGSSDYHSVLHTCKSHLGINSCSYILSTNLFSTFSALKYYEKSISHIPFKANSNASLSASLPRDFNWLKIYHHWATNHSESLSKDNNLQSICPSLHLTDNYIVIKDCNIKSYSPLSLGLVINASKHILYKLQSDTGYYNVKSQAIHVLFNPDKAILFKQDYILPVKAIIAVK